MTYHNQTSTLASFHHLVDKLQFCEAAIDERAGLLWVKSGHSVRSRPLSAVLCPLCAKSRLMQCSINCNDEGTCDERGPSIGLPSDLPQLGDFRAAVFCVKASKIVQSRAAPHMYKHQIIDEAL